MNQAKAKQLPKARLKAIWDLLYEAGVKWSSDNVPRLSAAVSFYAALSLAPFMIIGTVVAVYFIGTNPQDKFSLIGQTRETLGVQASELLQHFVQEAQAKKSASAFASLFSFVVMFFSASNLFLQFDESVRSIWGVKQSEHIVKVFIKSRLAAFGSVIVFGVSLILWLFVDARMAFLAKETVDYRAGRAVSFLSTFIILALACMFTMKRLAAVKLAWSDVFPGAVLASLLISIAKYLLSLYFANSGVENVYGPAGALVVILLWIYYCLQIYFFGLEIVCVYSKKHGTLADV